MQQAAQDAIVVVSGVEKNSATNKVTSVIDGVDLNLVNSKPGTDVLLTVGKDTDHTLSLVKSFVSAYNTLQSSLASLDTYNASTGESGPLFGDSMLSGIRTQLRRALSDDVSGATSGYSSLASLGVTLSVDGKLSVDETKLQTALSADFTSVGKVLSGENGVAGRFNSAITTALLTGGGVAARSSSLTARQTSIDKEKSQVAVRTASVKARYLKRFNNMDSLLASMQKTSTYLTQQTDALNRQAKS